METACVDFKTLNNKNSAVAINDILLYEKNDNQKSGLVSYFFTHKLFFATVGLKWIILKHGF